MSPLNGRRTCDQASARPLQGFKVKDTKEKKANLLLNFRDSVSTYFLERLSLEVKWINMQTQTSACDVIKTSIPFHASKECDDEAYCCTC